jgi:hypothetical protein
MNRLADALRRRHAPAPRAGPRRSYQRLTQSAVQTQVDASPR